MNDLINWDLDEGLEQPNAPKGNRYSLQQQEGEWGIFSAQEQRLRQTDEPLLPDRSLSPQVRQCGDTDA
ncbi:MAG: hypothetical protein V7752_07310 [Halopseudomonas sp.]